MEDSRLRQRVLAADVEIRLRRANRERLDHHRLDDGEGITLHEDPVLERAGLGFVGVADEVVRLGGLLGDGGPLSAGRECRAATTNESRRSDLVDDLLRPDPSGALERTEATVGAVVLERCRVDDADAGEEPQARLAGLRDRRVPVFGPRDRIIRAHPHRDAGRIDQTGDHRGWLRPGDRDHRRGCSLAQSQARRPQPGLLAVCTGSALRSDRPGEVGRRLLGPRQVARDVVADVGDDRRARLRGEQRVERRDAVGLGGRHGQPPAGVVECRLTDPADT